MDYNELKQAVSSYGSRDLAQRKNWYSSAADAYDRARPNYPQSLVDRVVQIAALSDRSKILEIGCGPGTATTAFAQLGCEMLCLEPNLDFTKLARKNCDRYPHVEIQNTSFEEWVLAPENFDAVLAASSFHWLSPDLAYLKAARSLQPNGYLILLWNKELQPTPEIYQYLSKIYQVHAPALDRYEDRSTQLKILAGLGQIVTDSGEFKDLVSSQIESTITYSVDRYLMLLNTYSPYSLPALRLKILGTENMRSKKTLTAES